VKRIAFPDVLVLPRFAPPTTHSFHDFGRQPAGGAMKRVVREKIGPKGRAGQPPAQPETGPTDCHPAWNSAGVPARPGAHLLTGRAIAAPGPPGPFGALATGPGSRAGDRLRPNGLHCAGDTHTASFRCQPQVATREACQSSRRPTAVTSRRERPSVRDVGGGRFLPSPAGEITMRNVPFIRSCSESELACLWRAAGNHLPSPRYSGERGWG